MQDTIIVESLNVRYGDRVILENVNFSIKKGEIVLICGGSGCGKSSLMRQIIGLEQPYKGNIYINGLDILNCKATERNKILTQFGVLFQSGALFGSMTLAENMKLLLDSYTPLSEIEKKLMIEMKLNAVGLGSYGDFYPSEISGGMKKRAALARAITLDPDILFFDEPASGLDPVTSAAIDSLILNINKVLGTTMFIVSHDLASIFRIADRIIMLDKSVKGILAIGTPDTLRNMKENPLVFNFFNRIA
ncbi:MAG TPA: ATP-binding cassette domain-containing protein [Candidatus Kapabacteria bacterium]|nr:ATP-binding cassette domain-containing protein [Candidatus Kapabacteria bacterium]